MSEPLLNVMKIMLLAGLYLFFVRVLWSVYNELRDPRTRVPVRDPQRDRADVRATTRGPTPTPAKAAVSRGTSRGGVAAPPAVVVGQLVTLEPPHLVGRTWALGNEITIGRGDSCGVHIDDTYVSGIHARVFNTTNGFMVEDLDSRNGTLLNGLPLTASHATALTSGDRLQIGATVLEFS